MPVRELINVNDVKYTQLDYGDRLELVPVDMFPSVEALEKQKRREESRRRMGASAYALSNVE